MSALNQLKLSYMAPDSPPAELREQHGPHGDVPSILKWTGSKRSQSNEIAALVPVHARYFEPFIGGGALLFHFAKPGAVASDIYAPLVEFWNMVRDAPQTLAADYAEQWQNLQNDFPNYYYVVRERFNSTARPEDLNFLTRTCVNGIVRFNSTGKFNNSLHVSRRGMSPQTFRSIVLQWSRRITAVKFRHCDYSEALDCASAGDFVYLDPPYQGNKQRYIGDLDLQRFYRNLEKLNSLAVKWALSFDGRRGERTYSSDVPRELYQRRIYLRSGYSAVEKVLNGPVEPVTEALYLNYVPGALV